MASVIGLPAGLPFGLASTKTFAIFASSNTNEIVQLGDESSTACLLASPKCHDSSGRKRSTSPKCGFAFQETKAKNLWTFVGRFSFDLSASLSSREACRPCRPPRHIRPPSQSAARCRPPPPICGRKCPRRARSPRDENQNLVQRYIAQQFLASLISLLWPQPGAANVVSDDALARKDSFFEPLPNWFGSIRQCDQGRPVQPTGDVAAVTIR